MVLSYIHSRKRSNPLLYLMNDVFLKYRKLLIMTTNKNTAIALLTSIFTLFLSIYSISAQSADDLYTQGVDKVKRLKRVEAKNLFTQAISADAKHAGSYYQRALIHKHFNELDKALGDFKQVTFIEADFKTEAHFEIGMIKVAQNDYKGAAIDFSIVLNEDSTNSKAYYLRGNSNKLSKDYEVALIDFKKAIKYDSSNIDAYFEKGTVEYELKEFDAAIESFTKVTSKEPNHALAYFYRGSANYEEASSKEFDHKKKHLHNALADYSKALELDESLEEAYFDRGEVKMELNDYIGAISDFKKSVELKPNDLEAHYLKAICNYHYGYEDIANKEMLDILKIDSTYANAQYFVAEYLYEKQEYKQALLEFNKLFELETPHADAYVFRGYTKFELGDEKGACDDWKEAQKLGDKEAEHDLNKYCKTK